MPHRLQSSQLTSGLRRETNQPDNLTLQRKCTSRILRHASLKTLPEHLKRKKTSFFTYNKDVKDCREFAGSGKGQKRSQEIKRVQTCGDTSHRTWGRCSHSEDCLAWLMVSLGIWTDAYRYCYKMVRMSEGHWVKICQKARFIISTLQKDGFRLIQNRFMLWHLLLLKDYIYE